MTNREAHEEAAGMNLDARFFTFNNIDPNAEYAEERLSASVPQNPEDSRAAASAAPVHPVVGPINRLEQ
jgi:hypothetical protein